MTIVINTIRELSASVVLTNISVGASRLLALSDLTVNYRSGLWGKIDANVRYPSVCNSQSGVLFLPRYSTSIQYSTGHDSQTLTEERMGK